MWISMKDLYKKRNLSKSVLFLPFYLPAVVMHVLHQLPAHIKENSFHILNQTLTVPDNEISFSYYTGPDWIRIYRKEPVVLLIHHCQIRMKSRIWFDLQQGSLLLSTIPSCAGQQSNRLKTKDYNLIRSITLFTKFQRQGVKSQTLKLQPTILKYMRMKTIYGRIFANWLDKLYNTFTPQLSIN